MILNDQQKMAVCYPVAPLAINAGSGSGKTRCIIERIAYLVGNRLVPPNKLYVATFTNKAADEIKLRLAKAHVQNYHMIHLGTLHSIFYSIYRDIERHINPYFSFLRICAEGQQYGMLKRIIAREKLSVKDIRQVIADISAVKELGLSNEEVCTAQKYQLPITTHQPAFVIIYSQYNQQLRNDRLVDFDDMLLLPYLRMKSDIKILQRVQGTINYFLCDEGQDNSEIQHKLLEMVTKGKNYTVVFDIKQSIYNFRGASPKGLVSFMKRTNANIVQLPINYRSVASIVDTSNTLIKHSKDEIGVLPISNRTENTKVEVIASGDAWHEVDQVFDHIVSLTLEGVELRDIAILYRCHAQSRAFIDYFVDKGLPYISYSSDAFYSRPEIKTMISYLRLLVAPEKFKKADCTNVLKTPTRYVTSDDIEALIVRAKKQGYSYSEIITKMDEINGGRLMGAYHDYRSYSSTINKTTGDMLISIVTTTKILAQLEDTDGSRENDKALNIASFLEGSRRFPDPLKFLQFIDSVTKKKTQNEKDNAVRLLTIHAAKGREYKVTFVVGYSDGLLPHRKAEDIEEERRVAYVGTTRACDRLYLCYIDGDFGSISVKPSRFLLESGMIEPALYYRPRI